MIEKADHLNHQPLINTEHLVRLLRWYQLPLLFAFLGMLLFLGAFFVLFRSTNIASDIVFTTDASASAKSTIRVDVAGAVLSPGVYEFEQGMRIADALSKAGGLSEQADRAFVGKNVNRAAVLIDGGKIYIPAVGEATAGQAQSDIGNRNSPSNLLGTSVGKVNINTASQEELEVLPGVGPVTAGNIISGREYQDINELKTKKIVGEKAFEKLKDLISVW